MGRRKKGMDASGGPNESGARAADFEIPGKRNILYIGGLILMGPFPGGGFALISDRGPNSQLPNSSVFILYI